MSTKAIELADVRVTYGDFVALDGISLSVAPGEIMGLLGPNGAGKTTTVDVCCGLRPPKSGSARVLGLDVRQKTQEMRAKIGVVPQDSALIPELNAVEQLLLSASLYGMRKPRARIEELLRLMGLWERRKNRISSYSGGMRRRVALARALLHDPPVLFLDEPTLGVDPQARRVLWDHIAVLREAGRSILLTTNYLDEATSLCDRVTILDAGQVVASASPTELRRQAGLVMVLDCGDDAARIAAALERHEGVLGVNNGESELRVHLTGDEAAAPVVAVAASHGTVRAMRTEQPSLDDVFLQLTGRELRE